LTSTQITGKSGRPTAIQGQSVRLASGFWADRQATNRNRTIPAIYHQMQITGRIDAWKLHWEPNHPKPIKIIPDTFWDSDAGKFIEAVAYSLQNHPDAELEKQIDALIDLIEAAQQPDGYLNIWFTGIEPQNRWKNLRDWHELYNAGHLIEGAVAYYNATGKDKLLNVMRRYTDYIATLFGPDEDQRRGYPGHPEIEMALVRLYHATGDERYLNLSKYFVDERGQEPHYFDIEAHERNDDPSRFHFKTYHYCQAHEPVRDQKAATGHSVRAAYLYSAIADLVAEMDDSELLEVSRTIWDDLTGGAMYITGGMGPAHANEGFTFPYDLPNESAYAETCAAVALVFWAQRMFHIDPNSRYIDVMERTLYNGMLSGVSFEGEQFFYANPLSSYPHVNPYEHWSGIHTAEHYRRVDWFECACCPPNLARLVANVGSYFYSTNGDTLFVHLYNDNEAQAQLAGQEVSIRQQTQYPWDGQIQITIEAAQPTAFTVALRIPGWCHAYKVSINGDEQTAPADKGYVHLNRTWSAGDVITLTLDMPVERMISHPDVRHDAGNIALQHSPVVYCLEEADNGPRLANVALPRDGQMNASIDEQLFDGVGVITGDAVRVEPRSWQDGLYQGKSVTEQEHTPFQFKAVPYCFWANREPGEMRVWLREI